ncbi:MAG: ABC transporter substrate-binding protein [Rubrobacter sp.]|nr:ABC transporter substrate-binding protein [Rubrobacter sp.]
MATAGLVAAACGDGEMIGGGGDDGDGSTFTFGRGSDSVTLDPVNASDGESLIVARQVFDGLLGFAPESTDLVPALAAEIPEPEEDGLVYNFQLREDVEFHDGTPFDAEAVVFNFERWKDSENEYHTGGGGQSSNFSYYSSMFGGFDEESVIESVEATGEYEVRFNLTEPQGPFLMNIAMSPFGIASPEALEEDVEGFWQNPVGTGPFQFESWDQGSEVRLSANEEWWGSDVPESESGGGPNVDRVVFRSIDDNTARVAQLSGGELSAADGLTPDDVPTIEEDGDLQVDTRPPLNVGYLAMNNEREPFDDPLVREAMTYAVDMESIVDAFFGDTADPAKNPMPPTVPFYDDEIDPYEYDPDRARELLAEAGLEDGFQADLWYMPIPRPYMPDGEGLAQAMQQDLEEVGIDVNLETRE